MGYYDNPDRIMIGVDITTLTDVFEENYREDNGLDFDWTKDGDRFNEASRELDVLIENVFVKMFGQAVAESYDDDTYVLTFWGDRNNPNDIKTLQELQGRADDTWQDNDRVQLAIYDTEFYTGNQSGKFADKWGDIGKALVDAITVGVDFPEEFDFDHMYEKVNGMSIKNSKQIKSSAGSTDTEQILESLSRSYFPLNDNHTRTCHFVNRNGKWFLILDSAYDFQQNPDLGGNVKINADGSITVSGYRTYGDVVTNPNCDYARRNIVLGPLSVNITKDELDAIVNKDMGDRSYDSVTPYNKFYNKIRNFFRGRVVYNSKQIKSSKEEYAVRLRMKGPNGKYSQMGNSRKITSAKSGEVDPVAADELALCTVNDGDLYRQMTTPIITNLKKKIKDGTYNKELALKDWLNLVTVEARKYVKEFGSRGDTIDKMFNLNTRKEAAKQVAKHYEDALI